jgi:8-amino-7-oxononanoate synthase
MNDNHSALDKIAKQKALARILEKHRKKNPTSGLPADGTAVHEVPDAFYHFDQFIEYQQIKMHRTAAEHFSVESPFFQLHEGCAHDTTVINGRELINFGTYNYLDLNGNAEINKSVSDAIEQYGVSASASRLVAGERSAHRSLERVLADLYSAEAALTFVSGHATNVSTISTLFGVKDLIVYDQLIHNSIKQGALLSNATRQNFSHNDFKELDELLTRSRNRFEKVLICIEGLYSMDGDIPELENFIAVARKHKALLLVDEAHSLGVLGKTGRGIAEHFDVDPAGVDIWMGTLSKTLGSCGGYIAGSRALIEILQYSAPGFVYSVGMPPALAVGVEKAIEVMLREPERVASLKRNGHLFLSLAKEYGLNTGWAQGCNVIPVITGNSLQAVRLSLDLLEEGIAVSSIIHPAVEENAARLRFFISSAHNEEQIRYAVEMTAKLLKKSALIEN